ncbi:3356_t:CDS:2 [Entrophospora sp. SA101]|nr:3356_t:CDS:2 [Entrophospora sp. SA101]
MVSKKNHTGSKKYDTQGDKSSVAVVYELRKISASSEVMMQQRKILHIAHSFNRFQKVQRLKHETGPESPDLQALANAIVIFYMRCIDNNDKNHNQKDIP